MAGTMDLSWIPADLNVTETSNTYVSGWLVDHSKLNVLLEAHKRATLCSFVSWSDDYKKKATKDRRLLWRIDGLETNNSPFSVSRSVVLACQYGPPRKTTPKAKTKDNEDHHYTKRKRFLIQDTRKVGCTARLNIRYITRYEEYSVPSDSGRNKRQHQMDLLSQDLRMGSVQSKEIVFVRLPMQACHTNHQITEQSAFANRMHIKLREEIESNVRMGITSVPYIKKVLQSFVEKELAKENINIKPSQHDRAYYPTNRDIRNAVHRALVAGQYSGLDQENLENKISEWKKNHEHDNFFLRKCTGETVRGAPNMKKAEKVFLPEEDEDEVEDDENEEDDKNENTSFLWVHQTEEQRKLLDKYGDLVLIDATYKTTKYALPLFLLVIRTNVAYIPVAEFIVESETTQNIAEALELVKNWNTQWSPSFFMMDYSDIEYQAVQLVFPKASKYLCYFHVEQAWIRWTRQKDKNNLADNEGDSLLTCMRKIASARNPESYQAAVDDLKNSSLFRNNIKVQRYLLNRWLNIPERWCRAFSQEGFHVGVTTNNGVEALNHSLKTFYTKLHSSGSLTSLVQILVEEFIPDLMKTYRYLNYQYSSQYKKYNQSVPHFLHNMPRNVVRHCLLRYASARDFTLNDVDDLGAGVCLVRSQSGPNEMYSVELGSESRAPSCTCLDFARTYLPCKHMFAVFQHTCYSWNDLSAVYRSSPYLHLDEQLEHVAKPENEVFPDTLPDLDISLSEDAEDEVVNIEAKEIIRKRNKIKENLKVLDDLTFLATSSNVLEDVNNQIINAIDMLKKNIDFEDHLPLHKGITAKQTMEKKPVRQLPKRAKRKSLKKKQTLNQETSFPDKSIYGVKLDEENVDKLKVCKSTKRKTKEKINPETARNKKLKKEQVSSNTTATSDAKKDTSLDKPVDQLKKVSNRHTSYVKWEDTSSWTGDKQLSQLSVSDIDLQKAMNVVDKIWQRKEVNYIVANVYGVNITDVDVKSLHDTNWLTDQVIDAYFALLTQREFDKGKKVKHEPVQTMTSIINGTHSCKHGKYRALEYDVILGAYHERGGHWDLVVIEPKVGLLYFYNPLGETAYQLRKAIVNWRNFMGHIALSHPTQHRTWNLSSKDHSKQLDSYNCGMYCLLFAERHLEGLPANDISRAVVHKKRKEIASSLMLYEVYLVDCCPGCGFKANREKDTLIHCSKCQRDFHKKTHCVGEKMADDTSDCHFTCAICTI